MSVYLSPTFGIGYQGFSSAGLPLTAAYSCRDGFIKSLLIAKTKVVNPVPDRSVPEIQFSKPLIEQFCLPSVFNKNAGAPVDGLFLHVGPAAIARLIATIVVYAINAVFGRWARAHVRIEILKFLPSARSIKTKRLRVWVLTSLAHQSPSHVFGGFVQTVSSRWHTGIINGVVR